MNSANQRSRRRTVLVTSKVAGVALCGVMMLLQGCNKDSAELAGTEVPPGETVVISLETTFEGLLPDEFGNNVPRDLPTSDINEWGKEMLAEMVDPEVDEKQLAESLSKLLPAEIVERILRPRFVLRDSNHIRDCLWAREVAESVTTEAKSELDSVVDLFYFVVNTIHAVPTAESLPFGPFESALYGVGTAEDRAWVFATLLRQRRIPTMVFADESSDAEDEDSVTKNLMVGVLLNDSLYLFDAALGLPIASPDEPATDALVRQPATLTQLLGDPSVLTKMGIDEGAPYAITLDQFKKMQPQIIGDSSVWSRRMEGLRNGQPVEVKALIFEPLVSCGPFEGLTEIVSEHLSKVLPESNVGVWLYPEQQREARESVGKDADQSERLAAMNDTFKVPQPIQVGLQNDQKNSGQPKLEFTFGASWGTHRRGRIDQIMGRPEQAIPAYLKVQDWRTMPPSPKDFPIDPSLKPLAVQQLPDKVKARHLNAAEEAIIWRATCQLQKRAFSSAATDLEDYLRQLQSRTSIYPGRFKSEANYLAGIAMALSDNSRRGAAFLRKVDPEDSRHDASRWLAKRWTTKAE
ncbi:MAG: hypothetical protein ACKVII_11375 [Planctomycetales bacterium]